MILINLLPHREAARKRRKEVFQMAMFGALVVGLLAAAGVYAVFQGLIDGQQERNTYLQSEIAVLNRQIKDVQGLEDEIAALRERQKAVEDLQADRNLPVYLLSDLTQLLPEGVYLSSLKQNGLQVELKGSAQSNERVSKCCATSPTVRPGLPSRCSRKSSPAPWKLPRKTCARW